MQLRCSPCCCCRLMSSVSNCFQFLTSTTCSSVDIAAVALELQHLYRQASNLARRLFTGVFRNYGNYLINLKR